jgi:hypothetical protein
MRRFFVIIAVALHAVPPLAAEFQAGVGKAVITPEKPMWMSGYGGRNKPAEGKETELWAKALVLQTAPPTRIVLISLDLVGIDRPTSQRICERLEQKHGVKRESICLATSHTHCGPVVGMNLRSMWDLTAEHEQLIDAYTTALVDKVEAAVGQALKGLAPARVSMGNGTAGFAVNRRENKEPDVPMLRAAGQLKGPVDHEVMVLAVRDLRDKLLAVAFGYSCHATVMDYYLWSGDYPGFAMIELEQKHPRATALFFAGCGADQNPLPRRTVERAKDYGKQLADAVEAVLAKPMQPIADRLSMSYREIPLPLHEIPTRDVLVKESLGENKYAARRAKNLLAELAKNGKLSATYPYPVQTWKLGDQLTWIMLGGEVTVEYSLRLKKEMGRGKTWVAGYANDVMAYIPSLKVLKEGRYEGATSMVYYGLPSVWSAQIEELIVAESHRQAKSK